MNFKHINSVDDALIMGEIDFTAKFEQLKTDSGLVYENQAIVGTPNNTLTILGAAGKNYNIIQNSLFFNEILNEPLTTGKFQVKKCFQNRSKSVMELEYLNPEFKNIKGETFSHILYVWNDFSGRGASGAQFRTIRLVCTNGMKSSQLESEFSIKHFSTFEERIATGKKIILNSQKYVDILIRDIETFQITKISQNNVEKLFQKALNIKNMNAVTTTALNKFDTLLDIYNNISDIEKNTVWGAYNSLTNYFSHHKSFRGEDSTDSILFGTASNELENYYKIALEYCN